MQKSFVLLVLLLLPALASAQRAQPFLAVHGSSRVDVVPDIFPLAIKLTETGTDMAASQAAVEALTRQVLAKARELRIEERDIQIGGLDIAPRHEYDQERQAKRFVGNEYSRNVQLKFRSFEDMRAMIGFLPTGKQVQVNTGAFEFSGAHEARRKLLADAIADARATADLMAAGVGQQVVGVQTISSSPMSMNVGSYINAIDVSGLESSTILTAEQIRQIPVGRGVSSVALMAPGTVRSQIVLEKGSVTLSNDVYILYLLGDR